jgi:hypothetical protein
VVAPTLVMFAWSASGVRRAARPPARPPLPPLPLLLLLLLPLLLLLRGAGGAGPWIAPEVAACRPGRQAAPSWRRSCLQGGFLGSSWACPCTLGVSVLG